MARLLLIALTALGIGCAQSHGRGSIGEPCFEDETCSEALECWRGICVLPEDMPDAGVLVRPDGGTVARPTDGGGARDGGRMDPLDAGGPLDALVPDTGAPIDGGAGPIDPRPPLGAHSAGAGPFDVALDWERHRVHLSRGASGQVDVVDLASGLVTTITTGHRPEHLHFDPYRDEVVVALPIREHSSYWWDDEQEGYVGSIDAFTLEARTPIYVRLDPWDIVSDGYGRAYAMGGSGQWTTMVTVDLDTGVYRLGGSPRQATSLELHPSRTHGYGADSDLSPSDIERIDLGETATTAYDSPYHGDHPMCGALRIDPTGTTIHTRCGHVFQATDVRATDMTWVGSLGIEWTDLAFNHAGTRAYVLRDGAPLIHVYDVASLTALGTVSLTRAPQRVLVGRDYLVVVSAVAGGSPRSEIEVRAIPPY